MISLLYYMGLTENIVKNNHLRRLLCNEGNVRLIY